MKQGRKLTRTEKTILRNQNLKADDWQFLCDCTDDTGRPTSFFKIINKSTAVIRIVDRFKGRR